MFSTVGPPKHNMVTAVEIRPVCAAMPRLNENCISGFPRRACDVIPPLETSVRRPCKARGTKSHFLAACVIWPQGHSITKILGAFVNVVMDLNALYQPTTRCMLNDAEP